MEEGEVWWSGGTEPENCIACSVISLPPGFHPPNSSNSPLSPQVPSYLHSLLLVSFSRHFRHLSPASGLSLLPSTLLHLLASYRRSPPLRVFLVHTLGVSILVLSLRLEKCIMPPNLKVTLLGPPGGGVLFFFLFLFFSNKTQRNKGDEHRTFNQM